MRKIFSARLKRNGNVMYIKPKKSLLGKFLSSSAITRALAVGSVLSILMSASAAQAQSSSFFSIGQMLQPGGVDLGLGIKAEASLVTTGTGIPGNFMGQTGGNSYGGVFNGIGFDANRPIGMVTDATRVHITEIASIDQGFAKDFADSIGFHIEFTRNGAPVPIPVEYFYAIDIDTNTEWKTSFAFDGTTFISPSLDIASPTQLSNNTETVAAATWESDLGLPGIASSMPIAIHATGTGNGGADPDNPQNQAIFDYAGQSITDVVFLFGLKNTVRNPTGNQNSGVSAMALGLPAMNITKSASAGSLLPDGTVNVTYNLLVENTGASSFNSFSLKDDLASASNLGAAFNGVSGGGVTITPNVSTGGSDFPAPNSAFDGDGTNGDDELIDPTDTVAFRPGDSFTVAFTANVVASNVAQSLGNSATAAAEPEGFVGSILTENSDDDDDDSNGDNPTTVQIPPVNPTLVLTKVADDNSNRAVGDTITYTYAATNSGDVNISNVTISDDHTSAAGTNSLPVSGETADAGNSANSTDSTPGDSSWDLLAPGDTVTFTSSYVVTAADGALGTAITNTATATGTPASGTLTDPTASESVSVVFTPNTSLPTELPANVCSISPATEFFRRRAEWSSNGSDPFQPDTADSSVFSRVEPFLAGPGLTNINPASSQILISGADQPTFVDAYGAGDFIDYTVETTAGLPNTWVLSGSSENGGRNGNPFKIAMLMSDDNFVTATRIFTDVDVDGQGFDWITDGFSQQYLEAGTEYIFRVVFYDMANPGQEIAQDDFALSADQCADQGDANFPNSSANGGVHTLPSIRNHYIGAVSPDAEFFVNGDDNTAGDAGAGEEDVTFPTFNTGATATVNVPVTGSGGLLNAWIDWNQNEQFEASERVATDDVIPGGGASGTIPLSVAVPTGATLGNSWARLRWSPNSISDPTGDVAEGELEDHLVTVAAVTADLSITKTNTAGVNREEDQAADTVTSGTTTTYTLTVTNNGPDAVTGGVVTDVVGAGLTCAGTDPVTITGNGVPAGSFTVADLTGAGITLGTLEDTEATELTYSCTVN